MSDSPDRRDDRSLVALNDPMSFYDRIILSWRLFWDKRVSLLPKLIILIAVIYVLSPIDVLPFLLLGPVGMVDDAGAMTLLTLMLVLFAEIVPKQIVQEHLRQIRGGLRGGAYGDEDVIDGEVIEE